MWRLRIARNSHIILSNSWIEEHNNGQLKSSGYGGKEKQGFASIDRSVERWLKYVCSLGYSACPPLHLHLHLLHSTDGECISVSYRTANRRIRRNRTALWPCSTLLYTAWIKLNQSVLPRNEGRSANPLSIRFAIVRRTERTFSLFFPPSVLFPLSPPPPSFLVRRCRASNKFDFPQGDYRSINGGDVLLFRSCQFLFFFFSFHLWLFFFSLSLSKLFPFHFYYCCRLINFSKTEGRESFDLFFEIYRWCIHIYMYTYKIYYSTRERYWF